ncbi:MAG: hypothetical protein AB8B55_21180 [Mariniblastus sp.]
MVCGLEGTTINRQESYIVEGATVTDSGVKFEGGLRANLGQGNDDFSLQDTLFESFSIIYGGAGDDNIDVVDSEFMDRLVIQTYEGDDSIATTRSHFEESFYIFTLDGQDTVSMTDSMFAGDSFVVTGNHSDVIDSEGNHYMGDTNLVLSLAGEDTVQLTNPVVGDQLLGIFLGNDDDTINIDLTEASIEGTVKVAGQAGADQALEMEMSEEVADNVTVGTVEHLVVFDNNAEFEYAAHSWTLGEKTYRHVASRVTLDETTRILGVEWTGTYENNEFPRDEVFTIEIFENGFYDTQWKGQFDAPVGEALASFNVGNDFGIPVNRTDTGEVYENRHIDQNIFSYSADIDFEMEAGKTYWVSIHAGVSEQDSDYVLAMWQWGSEFQPDEERGDGAVFAGGRNNDGEWVSSWSPARAKLDLALRS